MANASRSDRTLPGAGELVGRAASDDGRITAAWTSTDELRDLKLAPDVMLLAPVDLAARVLDVVAAARTDLDRRRNEIAKELVRGTDRSEAR